MGLFNPPGFVDDFARRPEMQEAFARGWDAIVNEWLDGGTGLDGGSFFNWQMDTTPGEVKTEAVSWDAFPRFLERWFEEDDDADQRRWQAAETLRPQLLNGQPLRRILPEGRLGDPVPAFHRQQDEYCEWFAHTDEAGSIQRVTFTSEGPEYWQYLAMGTRAFFAPDDPRSTLAEGDLSLVGDLYRAHVDTAVADDDLVWPFDVAYFDGEQWAVFARKGAYNSYNKWNTTHGAMHLTHPANTLGAEITLAAQAAVLRKDGSGAPIQDTEALVCCSGYGDANRSSDPLIGAGVNGLATAGFSVSLADPVGLYIGGINLDGFRGPDNEDVGGAWRPDRGNSEQRMILRATFAVPEELGLSVDQVLARGRAIAFGGQISDEIQMTLTGLVKKRGTEVQVRQDCVVKCCTHPSKPVQAILGLTDDCASFPWDALAPVLPTPAPPLGVADRAGPAGDPDGEIDATVAEPDAAAYGLLPAGR